MKAIVQDTYGSPDVLELMDIDKAVAGADDVLPRVHAQARWKPVPTPVPSSRSVVG
jgi:NADPH:quinone reductase-like Zn-dependent oxidoreductase